MTGGSGGRPPKAAKDRRRLRSVRFSDREWAAVVAAAEAAGVEPAVYVRGAALAAAEDGR